MTEWADHLMFADRVHKTYPDGHVHALNGVSFGIREAEYVAITGPSGCGKSTLLNLLGALDRPDEGEIFFRGEPLSKRRDLDHFRARQIGFVFQSFFLLPTLTARENVQMPMFEGPPLSVRAAHREGREPVAARGDGRPRRPPAGPIISGRAAARGAGPGPRQRPGPAPGR